VTALAGYTTDDDRDDTSVCDCVVSGRSVVTCCGLSACSSVDVAII